MSTCPWRARAVRSAVLLAAWLLAPLPAAGQPPDGWPIESPPPPLLAAEVIFPDYELRQLDNGLQVVVVAAREQPVVNVRLLVRAGSTNDPDALPGVAAMAAEMLDRGAGGRTAQEIAATIDNIGGALSVGAGNDLSFVNVLVMKDSFDFALDLLADVARRPDYDLSEIARHRRQLLSSMQVSYDDPGYIASIVFGRLVYGQHPYGRPSSGTPDSLRRISREDLQAFHRAHYLPNNAILAIVGDVTMEEALAGVSRVLGDWERGELPVPSLIEPPRQRPRLVVVDKPGSVQTVVRAGHLALPRAHPDFLAFDLAIKILGGEGGNRLGGVLRTARSLTYSASADLVGRQFTGDFMAKTETRSLATAEVLRLMVDEIARLQRDRVRIAELAGAQDYLAGNFPLSIETPNAIATQVLEAVLFGLDLDALENYPERVRAVTTGDIQRVARNFLQPDNLAIVLVGDARSFVDDLAGVGFDDYELVSAGEIAASTADLLGP